MATIMMKASESDIRDLPADISEWSAKEVGTHGELMAKAYLERRGFEVLEMNWRCKGGEVDLVVKEGDELVLVEVKTRVNQHGNLDDILPELAVDGRKRRRYRRLALYYVADHPWMERIRFDVVAITLRTPAEGRIHHVVNAFGWKE